MNKGKAGGKVTAFLLQGLHPFLPPARLEKGVQLIPGALQLTGENVGIAAERDGSSVIVALGCESPERNRLASLAAASQTVIGLAEEGGGACALVLG
jgi:hypothetical protein